MNDDVSDVTELVRDVFISPIRSLIVIDDEFPTLDDLLEAEDASASLKALPPAGTDRLREILKFARGREIPWLVDVHDGKKITRKQEKALAPRLHPSDLMVLDYKLQGEELGGSAAIEIIRKLSSNNHFNLVLLYTKGNEGNVIDILREIALGLAHKREVFQLSDVDQKKVVAALEAWNDDEPGIVEKLDSEITDFLFLKTLGRSNDSLKWVFDEEGCVQLKEAVSKGGRTYNVSSNLILKWLFSRKQEELLPQFSEINLGKLRINADENCCWISGERLFVTLLSKQCKPAEFETKIVEAIVSSCPAPHRLLLTKMRTSIDQRGLQAEVGILRDTHIQAAWLDDFLNPTPSDEISIISSTVTRHWEAIGDKLRTELEIFGGKLRAQYKGIPTKEVMTKCGMYDADVSSQETLLRYNSYISTKQLDRGHLTTGHVVSFEMRKTPLERSKSTDETTIVEVPTTPMQIEYWICLSPACDMVPGQKSKPADGIETSKLLPFTAVRLHTIDGSIAVKKATDNLFIFLEIDKQIKAFSIHEKGDSKKAPEWEQMIAKQMGVFQADTKVLPITTITKFNGTVATQEVLATVIAQLRSEYALNLLQKLGAQLSRPGLGMYFK